MENLESASYRRTAHPNPSRHQVNSWRLLVLFTVLSLLVSLMPGSWVSVQPVLADGSGQPQGGSCVDGQTGDVNAGASFNAQGGSNTSSTGTGSTSEQSGSSTQSGWHLEPDGSEADTNTPGQPAQPSQPVHPCDAACQQGAVEANRQAAATGCLSGNALACLTSMGLNGNVQGALLGYTALVVACNFGVDLSGVGVGCNSTSGQDQINRRQRWKWKFWTQTTTWKTIVYLPCTPVRVNGRIEISCNQDEILRWKLSGNCGLILDVPPVPVYRYPFPRGLVTVPNELRLSLDPRQVEAWCTPVLNFYAQTYMLGQANHGNCSADAHQHSGTCGGDVQGYTFGFRWVRQDGGTNGPLGPVEQGCWDWGDKKGGGCSAQDAHTYIAASNTGNTALHDIPIKANGPRPVPNIGEATVQDWSQESYQASIPTFWTLWYNVKYNVAVIDFDPVYGQPDKLTGVRPIKDWTPRVSWKSFEYGWTIIDLRDLLVPAYYFKSWRQYECQDTTKDAVVFKGPICQQPPPDPAQTGFLPINVIDVQNVLVDLNDPNEVRPDR